MEVKTSHLCLIQEGYREPVLGSGKGRKFVSSFREKGLRLEAGEGVGRAREVTGQSEISNERGREDGTFEPSYE